MTLNLDYVLFYFRYADFNFPSSGFVPFIQSSSRQNRALKKSKWREEFSSHFEWNFL